MHILLVEDDDRVAAALRPALHRHGMTTTRLSRGRGVTKDQSKAVQLWKQAAETNNTTAEFNLGIQYMLGEGLAKSDQEGARWIGKAAEGVLVSALRRPQARLRLIPTMRGGAAIAFL